MLNERNLQFSREGGAVTVNSRDVNTSLPVLVMMSSEKCPYCPPIASAFANQFPVILNNLSERRVIIAKVDVDRTNLRSVASDIGLELNFVPIFLLFSFGKLVSVASMKQLLPSGKFEAPIFAQQLATWTVESLSEPKKERVEAPQEGSFSCYLSFSQAYST